MTRQSKLLLVLAAAGLLWLFSRTSTGGSMIQSILEKAGKLIHGEEGERLTAYKDSGGRWTIGRGHLIKPGERFHPYGPVKTITYAESIALFKQDLAEAQRGVALVTVPLNANETAALLSLIFNIGLTAFAGSTLLKKLNKGDRTGAAAEFLRWKWVTLPDGTREPQLLARREREMNLFLVPVAKVNV